MRKQSDLGDYEINAENEPVVGVSKVGLSGVAVRTANGFEFRFDKALPSDSDGYAFDDGFLPGENSNNQSPNRGWVFSNDEVPEHVVEALEDAGYEYGGGSGPKTTLSLGADEPPEGWVERAEQHAQVDIADVESILGKAQARREAATDEWTIEDWRHDDSEEYISVAGPHGMMQFMFIHDGDKLRYQGPLNTTEMTWTEVPDEPRAVAESYFGAEVVVDTEDLKEIAASRER